MTLRSVLLSVALVSGGATGAFAQSAPSVVEAPVGSEPEPFFIGDTDMNAWSAFAQAAEAIVEPATASQFALSRLRAEMVPWRDQFDEAENLNAARLGTIERQIAALKPIDGTELTDASVMQRLEELNAARERLLGPRVLAQEAFVRADGLITEIDAQSRSQEAGRLMTRGVSPANPAYWAAALATISDGFASAVQEVTATSKVFAKDGRLWARLFIVLTALAAATSFVFYIRSVLSKLKSRDLGKTAVQKSALAFIISVARVVLPVMGLAILAAILSSSGFFGLSGLAMVAILPAAGSLVFFTKWLLDQYFPRPPDVDGLLGYDFPTRVGGRRYGAMLGWTLAVSVWVDAFISTTRASAVTLDVVNLPFQVVVGWLMWKLGGYIVQNAHPDSDALFKRNRIRKFIGRSAQVFGVAGPMASVLGFGAAAQAITVPAVVSLAIVATLVVLQRLNFEMMSRTLPAGEVRQFDEELHPIGTGLWPIVVNAIIVAISLPMFALVWGTSVSDLAEIWVRFRAGFTVGGTTISPTSFLIFVSVFVVGYILTGVIKSSLKSSVLPRTQLDLGGQNAIVAGAGYSGIFLSALVAFSVAGIDLSSLAIVAGALSVGIGFGLQNIVSNFVSGIILLIERPIGEGDMIEVGGQMGYVRDISVRSTRIETFDRIDVIIPNADLVSGQVSNWTRGNLIGRATVPVGVAYGTDTVRVAEILQEIAAANPIVLMNPPPTVLLTGFGADSIGFEIRAIIRDVNFINVARTEMFQEIIRRFAEEGIEIPFAQRDVWLRNPEVLHPKGES